MERIKLGIDLGNGFIKGKSDVIEFVVPSSLVLKKNVSINPEELGKNYNLYKIGDIEFIAGKELEDPNFVIEASDLLSSYHKNNNRYNLKTYQLLMLATIADLIENEYLEQNIAEIEIVMGVPSTDLTQDNIKTIKSFLESKIHSLTKNNKTYSFKVIKTIVIEQPLATLLELAIDKNKLSNNILDSNNIVIDIGTGTTIIDTFFKGKRVASKSKTFSIGMKNIYEEVLNDTKYKNDLNISDIEQSIKNTQDIKVGRIKLDFDEINESFKKHLSNFINFQLKNELDNIVNDNKRLNIYLTGGGANLISDYLEKELGFEIVKDPQMAGARGMLKYNKLYVHEKVELQEEVQ